MLEKGLFALDERAECQDAGQPERVSTLAGHDAPSDSQLDPMFRLTLSVGLPISPSLSESIASNSTLGSPPL